MLAQNSLLVIGAVVLANFVIVQYLARPLVQWPVALRTLCTSIVVLTLAGLCNLLLKNLLVYLDLQSLLLILSLLPVIALSTLVASNALNTGEVHSSLLLSHNVVMNIALLEITRNFAPFDAILFSVATAAGLAALVLAFFALRQRSNTADVPTPLRGAAIDMLSAGLVALAFMGFTGIL
jgi:Na+-translocating ferredoxin:NAD+ oxidoreductase subunit A